VSNQRLVPLNVAALASAPAGTPKIGDLYYNTTNLKTWVYSSGGWVVAAGGGAAFQTSAPTGPQVGDIWVDSDAAINLLTPDDYLLKTEAATTYAPVASPTFTGTPAAPTPTAGTSTTQVATTAFVTGALAATAPLAGANFTGPSTVAVNSAGTALKITQTGTGAALLVEDSASTDASPFVITTTGSVGIGTSTPAALLDVKGNALINGVTVGTPGSGQNTVVGLGALPAPMGNGNVAIGTLALNSDTDGEGNTAVGNFALRYNTTGSGNAALGRFALINNTTGVYNVAVGSYAMQENTTGANNTAIGETALNFNTTGSDNTAIGHTAALLNTTGLKNTAIGKGSLYNNTTSNNTGVGYNSLNATTTGYDNVGIGDFSLPSNTSGILNTAIGSKAGYGAGTNANTTGQNNTFIGAASVGASATASNVVTLGNSSIATLRCQVTTITALSDARDKTNIEAIPAGLDFVNRLSPVAFDWNTRDGAKVGIADMGFIAQDLLQVMEDTGIEVPNLVSQENPDRLEAGYGTLIPVLVQAIKELTAQVKQLQEAAHA
jgi:hypothetical protein